MYMYMWIKQTKRRFWAARLMSLENDRFVNEPRGQMLMAVDSTVNECGLWKMLRAVEDPGGELPRTYGSPLYMLKREDGDEITSDDNF